MEHTNWWVIPEGVYTKSYALDNSNGKQLPNNISVF